MPYVLGPTIHISEMGPQLTSYGHHHVLGEGRARLRIGLFIRYTAMLSLIVFLVCCLMACLNDDLKLLSREIYNNYYRRLMQSRIIVLYG